MDLVTKQATLSLSASKVAPGGALTASGANWPATDTLTVTFVDANKTKTTHPPTPTDGIGSFTDSVAIPSTAAAGPGQELVTSTLTGATFTKNVTVT